MQIIEIVGLAATVFLSMGVCLPRRTRAATNEFFAMDNGLRDVESIADKAALLSELGYDGVTWRPGTTARATATPAAWAGTSSSSPWEAAAMMSEDSFGSSMT